MIRVNQLSAKGCIIWSICVLFFLYEFFLRVSLGAFQYPLMHDLHLSSFQYALISTTFFSIMYGIMQIPAGLLIENFGVKKVLSTGALICALSSFLFAHATTYHTAMYARICMGVGSSVGFLCLLVSIYEWLPHQYNALFVGLSQLIGTMGAILGAGPLEDLLSMVHIPWQVVFKYLAIIGGVFFMLIVTFVENSHEKAEKYVVLKRPEKISVTLLKLFSRRQAWYIAIFSGLVYFTIEYLSENEGRIFLTQKGLSVSFSSYMMTVAWLGYAFGCPLLGFLSDYFERRKTLLVTSGFCSVLSIIIIIFSYHKQLLVMGFFLLGIAASGQSIGFAIITEQFKKQFVSIGLALNNTMITVFVAINAPTISWLLDLSKQHYMLDITAYYVVFSVFILIACVALMLAIVFIKETFCKSVVEFNYLNTGKFKDMDI